MATSPKLNIDYGGKRIPSLLDSGSLVILIYQSYFEREIFHPIIPSCGEEAEVHQLFQLTATNNGRLSMSMYVEIHPDLLGIIVLKAGILISQEPNELLDECCNVKLPGVIC